MSKGVAVKTDAPTDSVASSEYRFAKERAADARLVKGVFEDRDVRGGCITFPFKKWQGEEITNYTLVDGHEYELPLGVVKHLNQCGHMLSKNLLDAQGLPIKTQTKVHRFAFKSSEFI